MMHRDPNHPELARESQDVDSPPQRSEDTVHFTGRGNIHFNFIGIWNPTTSDQIRLEEDADIECGRRRRERVYSNDNN